VQDLHVNATLDECVVVLSSIFFYVHRREIGMKFNYSINVRVLRSADVFEIVSLAEPCARDKCSLPRREGFGHRRDETHDSHQSIMDVVRRGPLGCGAREREI